MSTKIRMEMVAASPYWAPPAPPKRDPERVADEDVRVSSRAVVGRERTAAGEQLDGVVVV